MGKQTDADAEFSNAAQILSDEASKVVLNAFNEGYLMGMRHAEREFGGENED